MNKMQQVLFDNIEPKIDDKVTNEKVINNEIVHCRVCGRILKNPQSKLTGIGETCKSKLEMSKCYNSNVNQMKLVD